MAQTMMAVRRMADALLNNSGARLVKLRIPASATGGDVDEQLGLAAPLFQDLELSPAVFRNAAAKSASGKPGRRELIVSAGAVQAMTSSLEFGSAEALFTSAFGVMVDEVLLTIESSTELEAGGTVYAYRLTLREPVRMAP